MPPSPPPCDANRHLVCLGEVAGAHGLRGELAVRSFTADPDDIAAYGPLRDEAGLQTLTLKVTGHRKDQVIVRAQGIADRTAAEALRGLRLFVARDALPPPDDDEFYYTDLIGLAADLTGPDGDAVQPLGRVEAVQDFGAGPFLEIRCENASALLVPFTRAAVPEVDIAGGRIVVAALPGLVAAERDAPELETLPETLPEPLPGALPEGER